MHGRRRRGIQWLGWVGRLEDVEYGDDVTSLAHCFTDIQGLLNDLSRAGEEEGLIINIIIQD